MNEPLLSPNEEIKLSRPTLSSIAENIWELKFLDVSDNETSPLSRFKLVAGMLIAANLSAAAIWLSLYLVYMHSVIDYFFALGTFLAVRVYLYMFSKGADLTPQYVHILSVQRSKWASATILISSILIGLRHAWSVISGAIN